PPYKYQPASEPRSTRESDWSFRFRAHHALSTKPGPGPYHLQHTKQALHDARANTLFPMDPSRGPNLRPSTRLPHTRLLVHRVPLAHGIPVRRPKPGPPSSRVGYDPE